MEETPIRNTALKDAAFRQTVEAIADQLCLTIGGNFDHIVQVEADDDTIEKLQMVVNFVLATASQSIEKVKQAKAELEQQLNIRQKLERENAAASGGLSRGHRPRLQF